MNTEIWKDIKGFEGYYQISSLGRVRSLDRWGKGIKKFYEGKIIAQSKHPTGYMIVSLCKDAKAKTVFMHRLIAEAFIPNPDNKPEVNHINTIRDDNRIENLEWCTRQENRANPKTQENIKTHLQNRRLKSLQKAQNALYFQL